MNLSSVTNQILLGFSSMCLMSTVQAGIPVWSFSPIGSPVVSVSATETAVVKYTVTNNSNKSHQLVLSSNTPAGISQSGGPCVLAGKSPANPSPSYTLTLSINGSTLPSNNLSGGPSLCQINSNGGPNANQCYQPDANDVLVITRTTGPETTTLSTSVSPPSILALSVKDTATNAALTGQARYITIQNTGTFCFSHRTTSRNRYYHGSHDVHGNISPKRDVHGHHYPWPECNIQLHDRD